MPFEARPRGEQPPSPVGAPFLSHIEPPIIKAWLVSNCTARYASRELCLNVGSKSTLDGGLPSRRKISAPRPSVNFRRDRELKRRATSRIGARPQAATMRFDNPPTDRQSHAGALRFGREEC